MQEIPGIQTGEVLDSALRAQAQGRPLWLQLPNVVPFLLGGVFRQVLDTAGNLAGSELADS